MVWNSPLLSGLDKFPIAFFKNSCSEVNSLSPLPGASLYSLYIRIADF